jgi:Bacteriophage tail sheath protein
MPAIAPATTNLTAVLGAFPQGPSDEAVLVTSWGEFESQFGTGTDPSFAVYAVWQFFQNGGAGAWIVRVADGDPATLLDALPRLDQIAPQHFNILCIPDSVRLSLEDQQAVFTAAHEFCSNRHAFLIFDPPPPSPAGDAASRDYVLNTWGSQLLGPESESAATYYPWVEISDPWNGGAPRLVPPSGSVAGVYAANDVSRGVWKAPAGTGVMLEGVTALADATLTDDMNGELNIAGINCLRTFPVYGTVVWGARTMAGADSLASGFKYVPVRRLADLIELSLRDGLAWVALEPNGPPLWSSIVADANDFMAGLYAAGAFAGAVPRSTWAVTCDATTTTPADMLEGIVNVRVGFAPTQPAEFVFLPIALDAGPPPD